MEFVLDLMGMIGLLPISSTYFRLRYVIKGDKDSLKTIENMVLCETLGESTPQFIAQSAFMMRFGNVSWIQIFCVVFSFCSIFRLVAAFSITKDANVLIKVGASAVIALGSGLKLFLWAIIFANLRFYGLAMVAINVIAITGIDRRNREGGDNDYRGWVLFVSSCNVCLQMSQVTGIGIGLWIALFQWFIMVVNISISILMPYYCDIFPGEVPVLNKLIDPMLLLSTTLLIILVISVVVELLVFKSRLAAAWPANQEQVNSPELESRMIEETNPG